MKQALLRQHDFRALVAGGTRNAAALEAAVGFIATYVGDDHFLGARIQALPHHFRHGQGIGVGGLLGSAIPRNVGLNHHHVAARDEAPDAAQPFERLPHQRPGIFSLRHHHFRIAGVSRHREVAGERQWRFFLRPALRLRSHSAAAAAEALRPPTRRSFMSISRRGVEAVRDFGRVLGVYHV